MRFGVRGDGDVIVQEGDELNQDVRGVAESNVKDCVRWDLSIPMIRQEFNLVAEETNLRKHIPSSVTRPLNRTHKQRTSKRRRDPDGNHEQLDVPLLGVIV
jgi:hypothetical protein